MVVNGGDDAGHWCARFDLAPGEQVVHLQIRMSHGGMVGHASDTVRPGQECGGITYEAMAARGGGWLIVRDDQLVIQEADDDR
jgi:hypothetical protein